MKNNSFYFFFILFAIISCKNYECNYIEIKYAGRSDKPINRILFSTKRINIDKKEIMLTDCYLVSSNSYKKTLDFLVNEKDKQDTTYYNDPFIIREYSNSMVKIEFIITNRKQSIIFFNKLIYFLKKNNVNKRLILKLEDTRERINY